MSAQPGPAKGPRSVWRPMRAEPSDGTGAAGLCCAEDGGAMGLISSHLTRPRPSPRQLARRVPSTDSMAGVRGRWGLAAASRIVRHMLIAPIEGAAAVLARLDTGALLSPPNIGNRRRSWTWTARRGTSLTVAASAAATIGQTPRASCGTAREGRARRSVSSWRAIGPEGAIAGSPRRSARVWPRQTLIAAGRPTSWREKGHRAPRPCARFAGKAASERERI
ncbi:hypothetical protein SAMN05421539_112115 [Jannaschia seohaensis]|uniref:Uncharacterized protein n=1 Tax=Jannaschia seohaensis TaxID=475081 RepID=A0A2Y9B1B5_9RHOB|nr:hypothetical protein BCF38_112115 [Jannaschia seohaensis]SSA50251.1 hypothetical protein SAMN05421539_112115 [Jannaschia seohaensis]